MKDGDLNEEEAKEEEQSIQKAEEDKMVAQGKIAFKKPTKRESSDKTADVDPVKKKKTEQRSKKEKQKSLLSFADEEEEEDWPEPSQYNYFCVDGKVVPDWLTDHDFCFQKVWPNLLVVRL